MKETKCRLRNTPGHKSKDGSPELWRFTQVAWHHLSLSWRLTTLGCLHRFLEVFYLQRSRVHPLFQPAHQKAFTATRIHISPSMSRKSGGKLESCLYIASYIQSEGTDQKWCTLPYIFLAIYHRNVDKSKTCHFLSTLLGMQIIMCDLEGLLFFLFFFIYI